jgi:hypothetical protein
MLNKLGENLEKDIIRSMDSNYLNQLIISKEMRKNLSKTLYYKFHDNIWYKLRHILVSGIGSDLENNLKKQYVR